MLAIQNNIMAMNASRHLGNSYSALGRSVERLSSGLRINSSRDDAAGLAVRELMRAEIAIQSQGSRNAQDGVSMLQTMEGAMAVMNENLIRMMELAEQASTGSYSLSQRQIMNAEFEEMANEIERIAHATKFNEISMMNTDSGEVKIHVGTDETIDVETVDMTKAGLGIDTGEGGRQHVSDFGVADVSDNFAVNDGTADELTIQFTNSAGDDEQAIVVSNFDDATLAQTVAQINEASQSLGFDAEGNNLAYDAAEAVYNAETETYHLQLNSRDGDADGMTISLGGNWDGDGAFAFDGDGSQVAQFDAGSEQAGLNILSAEAAQDALNTVENAIHVKDGARAMFGYKMNRLESTISILGIQEENLQASESRISDVDVASEMAELTRTQVLAQAGTAMLAQANTMPQMALGLLG